MAKFHVYMAILDTPSCTTCSEGFPGLHQLQPQSDQHSAAPTKSATAREGRSHPNTCTHVQQEHWVGWISMTSSGHTTLQAGLGRSGGGRYHPRSVSGAAKTSTHQSCTPLLTTYTLGQYHLNYRLGNCRGVFCCCLLLEYTGFNSS